MGRLFPWEEIPDSNIVPDGVYSCQGALLEETRSQAGKLMYKSQMTVQEPIDYKGITFFEYFVIGSDEDLEALQPITWKTSIGARRMKSLFKAAQLPQVQDIDQLVASFAGSIFLSLVTMQIEKEGDYKGTPRNRLNAFYKVGERSVGLEQGSKGPAAAAAGAVPAAPVAPAPAVPTPVAPVAPTPPLAPAVPAAPAPPATPAAPATPVAAPAVGGAVLKCTICNSDVPVAEFKAHVDECLKKAGAA